MLKNLKPKIAAFSNQKISSTILWLLFVVSKFCEILNIKFNLQIMRIDNQQQFKKQLILVIIEVTNDWTSLLLWQQIQITNYNQNNDQTK